jgi:CRP-like cAMP-binding protein
MALNYAHGKGVVHRDIKPRNILLSEDLQAKITDFGVAVVPHLQIGQAAEHAGSPLYMAPEQVREEPATKSSDLFALGVVAYELLTGKHPFDGGNIDAIQHRILNSAPEPIKHSRSDAPEIYQRIIDKALAKNPAHRYKSGADLAGDISLVYDFLRRSHAQPTQQEKFTRTEALDFFAQFPDTELWEVINAAEWISLPADRPIIEEGAEETCFYVLVDGAVAVMKGDHEIIKFGPGNCFGEMGMMEGRRRTATIRSVTDVTFMKLRTSVIQRASLNCQLRFQRKFLDTLIERLEYATDVMVKTTASAPTT